MKDILKNQADDRSRLLNRRRSSGSQEALMKVIEWVDEMTAKHGNPNGTDYEQGQNDMGFRISNHLRNLVS